MNEILFFILLLSLASLVLLAFKLGKIYLYGVIAVLSVMMNIVVVKPFDLFGITTYGGNAIYGCIFLATDLLAEHFGKKEAMKAVRIGFFSLIIYFLISFIYTKININLEIEGAENIQNSLNTIFSPALGIAIASISAFFVSNTFDVNFYDFIHKKTGNSFLWLRNNLSTLISQFLDTLIFTLIASLFGIFSWEIFWEVIFFAYIFKLFVALLDTPFLYLSKLKFFRKNLS